MEESNTETNDNAKNQTTEDQKIKIWKFDLSLTYIKSIFGIFTVVLMGKRYLRFIGENQRITGIDESRYFLVMSLLCLIVLGAAKKINCYAAYTAAYGFYNFAFASCFITYLVRFIIYVFTLNTRLLWIFPWLIWNVFVSLFFALVFFFSSIAVVANTCGQYYGGYKAAGALGFITFFIMCGEMVYNFILLRRDHPPTENRFLIKLGVERKPPVNAPVYSQDGSNATEDDSKY